MSTPPRPRPDRDDITAVRTPEGADRFAEIVFTAKGDGSAPESAGSDGGSRGDASEYEEIKWELKADGSDRDGPGKHHGDHAFEIDRSADAHPEAQEFGVAAAGVAMVEIPELQLDDPTLETPFVSDDSDLDAADSTDLGDADLLDG